MLENNSNFFSLLFKLQGKLIIIQKVKLPDVEMKCCIAENLQVCYLSIKNS